MAAETAQAEALDWTTAKLYGEYVDGARLVVEGDAPVPMRVELHPMPIPTVPEEYRAVQVRGHRGDYGPEVVTHFKVEADTKQLPHGTVGFVLVGATMREYFPPRDNDTES